MGVGARRDHPGRRQPSVPDHVDGPAAPVVAPGGHDLRAAGERGEPLGAGARPGRRRRAGRGARRPPRTARRRRGRPSGRRQRLDAPRRGRRSRLRRSRSHQGGVRRGVGAAVAGGQAAAHLGQHAGRPGRCAREPVGALPDREGLVQRGQARSATLPGGERAEVVGVVVEHPAHQRQPRPRLVGELEEVGLLREAGAAVVARLVLGDQAQLAHLGLQRGGAHDAGHRGRQADHLAHPGPGLGGGEVGADPGAQVARGADVEHPLLLVAEQVDARRVGEALGEVSLAALRGARPGRRRSAAPRGCARPRPPTRSISPCSTSTVARASESARWLGVVVALKVTASEDSLQLGASSRVITRRASRAVSSTSNGGPGPALLGREVPEEADVERGVVGHQHACRRRTPGTPAAPTRSGGASATMELVMPVSTAMNGGIARVRVDQGLELAEHLAAAHLHRADLGDHASRPRPTRRWSRGRPRRTSGRAGGGPARRSCVGPPSGRWSRMERVVTEPTLGCRDRHFRAGRAAPAPGPAAGLPDHRERAPLR